MALRRRRGFGVGGLVDGIAVYGRYPRASILLQKSSFEVWGAHPGGETGHEGGSSHGQSFQEVCQPKLRDPGRSCHCRVPPH